MTEQPSNVETTEKPDESVPDRNMILGWLKEEIMLARDKTRADNPGKNTIRIQWSRTVIMGCSAYLQGLHDRELDELAADIQAIKVHVGMVEK
ncbi:hypothetical protein MUO83_07870 [Candidatus Bathyarchaeota archaeon]|nr:hypothetical protein [Candidatus Bathyarchaeota archaeon]